LATGIVTVATGVFVVPTVPYLQALEMEREDLIQALGLNFTVSTFALAGGLLHGGVLRPALAGFAALALVAAMAGMFLGQNCAHAFARRYSGASFSGGCCCWAAIWRCAVLFDNCREYAARLRPVKKVVAADALVIFLLHPRNRNDAWVAGAWLSAQPTPVNTN